MTPARWAFDAIGTPWEIESVAPLGADIRHDVTTLIDGFDRDWSRFRDDSTVTRLGVAGGEAPAPPDTAALLGVYRELDAATGGAVNPLVGAALARRGYDARITGATTAPKPPPPIGPASSPRTRVDCASPARRWSTSAPPGRACWWTGSPGSSVRA